MFIFRLEDGSWKIARYTFNREASREYAWGLSLSGSCLVMMVNRFAGLISFNPSNVCRLVEGQKVASGGPAAEALQEALGQPCIAIARGPEDCAPSG